MILANRVSEMKAVMGIVHGSRAFGGPLLASIELTSRCNLRCIHCYYYSPYVERPNFFSLRRTRQLSGLLPDVKDLVKLQTRDADSNATKKILDDLIGMGTQKFYFSGSGEPFLHNELFDFISRVRHAERASILYTNGTLLDRYKIDELIALKCSELKITTLAGSPDVYERTHPGIHRNAFDKLKENLLYLADRKARSGTTRPEVSLHYVVLQQNCDDIENFIRFASAVHADRIIFMPVETAGDQGLAAGVMLTENQQKSLKNDIAKMRELLRSLNINNNLSHFVSAFGRKMDTSELYRIIPCYYGWLGVRFSVEGKVYACCRCYEPMGDVKQQDFRAIWYGSRYRTFRRKALHINRGGENIDGCECDSCPHFTANLLVYKTLHPLKTHVSDLKRLSLAGGIDAALRYNNKERNAQHQGSALTD